MQIEYKNTEELIPYANNTRTHSDEQVQQIASSIKEFGFTNPVLLDEKDGIIAGHGRVMAAKLLSLDEVPTITLKDLTDAQIKAYIIADNKLALNAGWDEELLKVEIEGLNDLGFDIDLLGFNAEELDDLDIDFDADDLELDEDKADEVPELEENPVIKHGDLIELGMNFQHRVLCGDSTSEDDVKRLMNGDKSCLLFSSPPYADMRSYNDEKDLSITNIINFIKTFSSYASYIAINLGLKRKNKEIDSYWDEYISIAKESGYKFLSWNIWNREGLGGSIGNQTAMFPIWHEWIFVFGLDTKDINKTRKNKNAGVKTGGTNRNTDGTSSKSKNRIISEYGKIGSVTSCGFSSDNIHPAMFPVELPTEYILAMSSELDIIIDPFLGSGTTLIASENLTRKCYGMELDEKYAQVIIQRYCDYTSIDTIKINGKEVSWSEYKDENRVD